MPKIFTVKLSIWGAVVLAAAIYIHWLNTPPTVAISVTVIPSPNGRDALYSAYRLLTNAKSVEDALPGGDDYNAIPLFKKRALVASNAVALGATRTAMSLPYWNTENKFAGANRQEFADIDALYNLLILEASVRAADGDAAGSMNSDLDGILLGALIRRGGGLDAECSADSSESLAVSRVWPLIARLSEKDTLLAARRLEAITRQRIPFSVTIEQEKRIREQQMIVKLRTRTTFSVESDYIFEDGSWSEVENTHDMTPRRLWAAYKSLLTQNKSRFFADYATMLDAYIACSKRPFNSANVDPGVSPNPALYGANIWYFVLERQKDARVRADSGLLLCTLALRAYNVRHGANPISLAELISDGELQAIPDDPFAPAASTPFRYRRVSAGKYLLYSVGPDGVDDGGKPVGWSKSTPKGTNDLELTSKGDWVAGANIGNPQVVPVVTRAVE